MGRRGVGEGATGSAPTASAGVTPRWPAVGECAACLAKARAVIGRYPANGVRLGNPKLRPGNAEGAARARAARALLLYSVQVA